MTSVSHRGLGSLGEQATLANGALVGFRQSGAAAVQRNMQDKVRETVSITDYGSSDTTNWRAAIVAAMAELTARGGGTLYWPARSTPYIVDNTGAGPISWTTDGIRWIGADSVSSEIEITTSDGTAFIEFAGAAVSVQNVWFDHLYLNSQEGAGHIWSFATKGWSKGGTGLDFRVYQRDPNHNILTGTFAGGGGMLEVIFQGEWEFGSSSNPATVPAVKINDKGSLFGPVLFDIRRIHCHDARAPFLWMNNSSAGAWSNNVKFYAWNVEGCRSGLVYAAGAKGWRFQGPSSCFDSDNLDRDVFEMRDGAADANGPGGQANSDCRWDQIIHHGGTLVGVAEDWQAVSALSQAAGVATATAAAHGFVTGDLVDIIGATPGGYEKDSIAITVTGVDTFTYACSAGLASPATGSYLKVRRTGHKATSVSQVAGVATLTTTQNHGLVTGQVVYGVGWNQADYNGRFVILSTPGLNTLTFAVDVGAVTPGTGAGTWARAAMDVALLGSDYRPVFTGCDGVSTQDFELDAGNNTMAVIPKTDRFLIYRQHDGSFIAGIGADADSVVETKKVKTAVINEQEVNEGVQFPDGLRIGTDTDSLITNTFFHSQTNVSWGSINNGASEEQTVNVTGVLRGDRVEVAVLGGGLQAHLHVPVPQVKTDGVITIAVINTSGGALTPTTRTWQFTVFSHQ